MTGQWREFSDLAPLDFDESCRSYSGAFEKGRMLECARLFNSHVETHRGVGHKDPGILLGGLAQKVVHQCIHAEMVQLVEAFGIM